MLPGQWEHFPMCDFLGRVTADILEERLRMIDSSFQVWFIDHGVQIVIVWGSYSLATINQQLVDGNGRQVIVRIPAYSYLKTKFPNITISEDTHNKMAGVLKQWAEKYRLAHT